jgi:predicted O-methyltransferase YrrM
MIDLKLTQLKAITARWAEESIGRATGEGDSLAWSPLRAYAMGLAPERHHSLLHITEIKALDWIAAKLPPNSVVLEVGSFLGCSAAIMANANPAIQIKSIDLFDKDHGASAMQRRYEMTWSSNVERFLGPGARRTRDNVAAKLAYYSNISFIEGRSPDDFAHTDIDQVDVYFEDSDHSNPGMARNIDFWEPKVKPGGMVLLHDYKPWLPQQFVFNEFKGFPRKFPDVEVECHRLIREKGYRLEGTVSSLAILTKPL